MKKTDQANESKQPKRVWRWTTLAVFAAVLAAAVGAVVTSCGCNSGRSATGYIVECETVEACPAVEGKSQPAAAAPVPGKLVMRSIHGEETMAPMRVGKIARKEAGMSYAPEHFDFVAADIPMDAPAPGAAETLGYERYADFKENEFLNAAKNPLSTLSIDVDTASYATVRRYIEQMHRLPPKDSVRAEELVNYFKYDYPEPADGEPFGVTCELGTCPWKQSHRLLRVALQARRPDLSKLPPNNFVFLIDTSGSMAGSIDLLKKSFQILIDGLRPDDTVSIVTYAGTSGVLLPATRGDSAGRIRDAVASLSCHGSTAGAEGIQTAYKIAKENFRKGGNNRVILATDGDFNVGVQSDAELARLIEQKRDDGIFLTVLGFGYGNYQDAKMKKLADTGNGNYAYIDNLMEAKKVLSSEFGALFTLAKDVKIQIEFNPSKVGSYRMLGYECRLLDAKDFNDDKKDAGELGAGHSVTVFYELVSPGAEDDIADTTDELRYQETIAVDNPELLTLKLRWKEPDASESTRVDRPVTAEDIFRAEPSEDFRFASAVAEFALILRDSKFKGDASFDSLVKRAKGAKGTDDDGYRAGFISLAEQAKLLSR